MRTIPICSVEELKRIITDWYYVDFNDLGSTGIRDLLLDKYETITVLDRSKIEKLKYNDSEYHYFFDMLIECIDLGGLPNQFVLYYG